jgi:hypothetical protein
MARIRSRARVSRETTRRKFIWARTSASGSQGADSIGRTDMLANFESLYGAELIGCTVVRIRGIIAITSDTELELMAFAAMVEPNPVGTLETGEGPLARPYAPWMLYEPFTTLGDNTGAVSSRMIDVKASRKIDELDEQLSLYFQTPSGNAGSVSYTYTLSLGIKLP